MQKVRLTTFGKILITTLIAVLLFSTAIIIQNTFRIDGAERGTQTISDTSKEGISKSEPLKTTPLLPDALSSIRNENLNGISFAIYFYPNLDTIKEESYQTLNFIALLSNMLDDKSIQVEGNTVNVSGLKDSEFDKDLSYRRAKAVADFLISKGISSGRIKTIGNGSIKPASADKSDKGKKLNRRTDIFFK